MKSSRWILLIVICAVVASAATTKPSITPYDTVARKSIFSRDRIAWRAPATGFTPPPVPASPVITGIVREDVGYVAVLETPGSSRPVMVRLGDPLPGNRGVVTEMNLDCLVFVAPGGASPRKAYVGRNLDGAESTLVVATTGPSEAPIEGDDVISRMRRRRQQEGK